MSSPMFDGQFRSKPQVSLRGASKQVMKPLYSLVQPLWCFYVQVKRVGLLEKAHRDRQSREVLVFEITLVPDI